MKSENSVFSSKLVNESDLYKSDMSNYFNLFQPTDLSNLLKKYYDWMIKYPTTPYSYVYNSMFDSDYQNLSDSYNLVSTLFLPTSLVLKHTSSKKNEEFKGTQLEGADESILGLLELMNANPEIKGTYRITSLYRPNAKTKSGNISHHSIGRAVDIVPINGSFEELERKLMQDESIVNYMKRNNIGILDEYTPNGYQKQTGATGNHMHIGPDKLALKCLHNLLVKYGWV